MGTRRIARGMALSTSGVLLLAGPLAAQASAADLAPTTPSVTLRASALLPWHVAPSLIALRAEVNSRWPNRDRSSDGTIGDSLHQAGTNSHNAVGHPGGPSVGSTGAVHALDITSSGIDVDTVLDAVIGDARVWYVIYGGRIWSRTNGWVARSYSGDPHTTHIHVNLREDSQSTAVAAENDTSRLIGNGRSGRGTSAGISVSPAFSTSMGTSATKTLQRALIAKGFSIPSGPTGWYGPETTRAVKAFQQSQGWSGSGADGIAGAETLRRLGVGAASGSAATATTAVATTPRSTSASSSSTGSGGYVPGTASTAIYYLQQALIERGYSIPAGPTGYYGAKTVDAVKAFQQAQGWTGSAADGVAGSGTRKALGL